MLQNNIVPVITCIIKAKKTHSLTRLSLFLFLEVNKTKKKTQNSLLCYKETRMYKLLHLEVFPTVERLPLYLWHWRLLLKICKINFSVQKTSPREQNPRSLKSFILSIILHIRPCVSCCYYRQKKCIIVNTTVGTTVRAVLPANQNRTFNSTSPRSTLETFLNVSLHFQKYWSRKMGHSDRHRM